MASIKSEWSSDAGQHINMSMSPQKRSTSSIVAPIGHKLFSFAKSRLPVPKPRTHRRAFLSVAPVPFAPLVDTHAFQPPPPYSVHADDSTEFLPVPHNTPEASRPHGLVLSASTSSEHRPIGLGLGGVERGDGCRFDGLGRLSGGFRSVGTGDALREEVHRMLSEQRRRTRTSERPTKRHDVFYASVEVQGCDQARRVPVTIRIRRKSVTSPTPSGLRRGTISSELKRAASLERRASLSETTSTAGWRV